MSTMHWIVRCMSVSCPLHVRCTSPPTAQQQIPEVWPAPKDLAPVFAQPTSADADFTTPPFSKLSTISLGTNPLTLHRCLHSHHCHHCHLWYYCRHHHHKSPLPLPDHFTDH